MLTKVEVRNSRGNLLELPLWENVQGYQVADIEGLDPVPAVLSSSSFARLDGDQYQSSRKEKRNIIFTLDLEGFGTTSVEDLRQGLYPWFMSGTPIQMRFIDHLGKMYDISGRVESMDAPLFTKEPQAIISVVCFDPAFLGTTEEILSVPATNGPSEHDRLVLGSIEAGFAFRYVVPSTIASLKIFHYDEENNLETFEIVRSIPSAAEVRFETRPRQKSATIKIGNTVTSILNSVTPESKWFHLHDGINRLRIYSPTNSGTGYFHYIPRYGGL